jgi:hypothetical protein
MEDDSGEQFRRGFPDDIHPLVNAGYPGGGMGIHHKRAIAGDFQPDIVQNFRYLNALIPLIFLVPGLILAARFPLTPQKIEENRRLLEARRGAL